MESLWKDYLSLAHAWANGTDPTLDPQVAAQKSLQLAEQALRAISHLSNAQK